MTSAGRGGPAPDSQQAEVPCVSAPMQQQPRASALGHNNGLMADLLQPPRDLDEVLKQMADLEPLHGPTAPTGMPLQLVVHPVAQPYVPLH